MNWLLALASAFSLLFALFHVVGAKLFAIWLGRQPIARPQAVPQELAGVLVASRGFDPSLPDMLRGLLDQDYPAYEVHVTVDETEGPACDRLAQLVADHPHRDRLQLHSLGEPLTTCGLKNSALLVGLRQLSPRVTRIAMIDTDIVPPRGWLGNLLAYLDDPQVGAVSGAQWFDPGARIEPGTQVRSLWNAAALVPTCMFANAWAGSLAFRREAFDRAGLAQIWERTIVDDGPLPQAMRQLGLRMQFAPNMLMLNRESCSYRYVNNWLQRMLCWSRLYESSFRNTLIHALLTSTLLALLGATLLIALGTLDLLSLLGLAVAWLASNLLHVAAWRTVRGAVIHASQHVATQLPERIPLSVWLGLISFVPVTQFAFCLATFRALALKRIRWRGVEYEIESSTSVRLLARNPVAKPLPTDSGTSI
jgi:cellulose synthase/poly-beta-1,6-N-acetylglucosamine synthase-like glycosyltransferase